jgi:YidC/Oxa1 family membrane protein insertase
MEKRLVLAMVLTALVLVVIPRLFQTPPIVTSSLGVDTGTAVPVTGRDSSEITRQAPSPGITGGTEIGAGPAGGVPSIPAETTVVAPRAIVDSAPLSTYRFVNQGATLVGVELLSYQALTTQGGNVQIAREGEPLLRYRLALAQDTVVLDDITFQAEQTEQTLTYSARIRDADVAIAYTFVADSYVVRVRGTVQGGAVPAHLLIDLPRGIRSEEADSTEDHRHLAYAYKPMAGNARSIRFDKLDPGETQRYNGPLNWVVTKNKYFVVGLLTPVGDTPFQDIVAVGGPRTSKVATTASATIVEPVTDGQFTFEIYAGPQDSRRLLAMGRDFQDANPYGGWLQGVVQPFARIVMQILLWIRDTFQLNYGWVLVIFGIAVRIALWPLNQRAMRASLRMQQIQPQLMEVQKRYQDNPEKQRSEMMRVYKEHDMTPFSPMVGCLPMLLPMPILFALFFVFQNTIEFRGVSFLWLPDISLKDPYYIVPILMGLSMFVLSWIGIRNAPPNPQAKMMAYFLPVLMTVFFLNFASGLNLYYAVQNIAALPQQWLIANERAKTASIPRRT